MNSRFLASLRRYGLYCGFILASIAFVIVFRYPVDNSYTNHNKLQTKIRLDLAYVEQFAKKLIVNLNHELPADSLFNFINSQAASGIDVFIYNRNQPVAWTTSRIVLHYEQMKNRPQRVFANDGVYLSHVILKDDTITAIFLKKFYEQYSIANKYMQNGAGLNYSSFGIKSISENPGLFNIKDSSGRFLFSVNYVIDREISVLKTLIACFFFLLAIIFFTEIVLTLVYSKMVIPSKLRGYFALGFLFTIRLVFVFFKFPGILFTQPLFQPAYYGSGWLSPSLGDAFINSVFLLLLILILLRFFFPVIKDVFIGYVWKPFFLVFFGFIYWAVLIVFANDLIVNSSFVFSFSNPFQITEVALVGIICISIILTGYILVAYRTFLYIQLCSKSIQIISFVFFYGMFIGVMAIIYHEKFLIYFLFPCFLILLFYLLRKRQIANIQVLFFTFIITLTCLFFASFLVYIIGYKELSNRRLLVYTINSRNDDPIAAANYYFQNQIILRDSSVQSIAESSYNVNVDSLSRYLIKKYFYGYWSQYKITVTVCKPGDVLYVKPEAYKYNCFDYFSDLVVQQGYKDDSISFLALDYGQCLNGYLARIIFRENTENETALFIEFIPKLLSNDVSLPELFVDRGVIGEIDLTGYSFARYINGRLIAKIGEFNYSQSFNYAAFSEKSEFVFNLENYNHFLFKTANGGAFILSRSESVLLDFFSSFSYLWLFLTTIFLCIQSAKAIYQFIVNKQFIVFFSNRIQIYFIGLTLISFFVIGIFTVYFYKNFYDTKNRDFISDKVHSIQLEIQNKILDYDSLSSNNQAFISDYLTKFANVFFADIHIYSIRGELFTTSRPELFDLGFMSGLISPTAYMKICYQSESVFVVKENIGAMQYYSAYVPLVNHNNKLIGIVNVPFFAKHNEFEKDVSKYLATFLNVFLFLAILAILLAFVITNQFVRPLRIISAYFADLKIGQANTRIAFNRKDEIGQLIMLYNSMVDQLEDAVVRLREKERESAWKDVARQVAHEIKNPLTPIKLGLQFLIHARRRNDPDWELKFTSFSESLFQQIESLNQLANSFSEFTQLPESEYRNELLAELINNSAIVLNDFKGTFQIVNNSPERVIYCDKNQISRVLINLFKNAMQAIPEQISGVIQVKVTEQGKEIVIQLTDNGIGISKLDEHKIFSPNFTTKSGGMGIGLFMSKVIIEGHGGRIWFESDSGKGTIFYISLPLSTN